MIEFGRGGDPEDLAAEWRKKLRREGLDGRIPETDEDERICPECGDVNPCTGVDHCTSCGAELDDADRDPKSNRFNPKKY